MTWQLVAAVWLLPPLIVAVCSIGGSLRRFGEIDWYDQVLPYTAVSLAWPLAVAAIPGVLIVCLADWWRER